MRRGITPSNSSPPSLRTCCTTHTHTSSLTVQKGFTSCSIHAPAAPVPLPSDCQRDTLDCPHGRGSCQCLH